MYIAVCDDQIEELEKLTALLQAWQSDLHSDVRFQTFRSGGQLLDAARAERFTLYLLDVLMPGMTGMDAAREIRSFDAAADIIFLTTSPGFAYESYGVRAAEYLLKPISMTELTAELEKIHKKIVARLASLTDHRGPGERQLMTASLLLDEFCRRGEIVARLAQSGVAISTGSTIISGAIRAENADPADLLAVSERVLSRVCGCCGFCADERVVLLLASETGFGALYGALDELRQAIRRTCGAEAQIGLSKEYASVADGHAAYLEAMEALQATHSGEVQAAGGWDDMAVLCARTLKILEKEYMDETLTLQSVSERLHVSPNYLGANLKKHAGDTFMNLLIKKRMDVARNLLQNGTSRIAEVARRCGYSDQSYFGYCFKKYYGLSPARMRQTAAEYGETAQ